MTPDHPGVASAVPLGLPGRHVPRASAGGSMRTRDGGPARRRLAAGTACLALVLAGRPLFGQEGARPGPGVPQVAQTPQFDYPPPPPPPSRPGPAPVGTAPGPTPGAGSGLLFGQPGEP